jgi:uncharacterized membrane protein
MKKNRRLGTALALGAMAGMRSMSVPALMSHELTSRRFLRRRGAVESALSGRRAEKLLLGIAVAELIGDKLPFAPARTRLLPLAARGAAGAIGGWIAGGRARSRGRLAIAGAVAAIGTAYAMYHLRTYITSHTKLPDTAVALVEDAAVAAIATNVKV